MNTNLVCPYCGKSHYKYLYSETTAVYYPEIVFNGEFQNTGNNSVKDYYECIECGKTFKDTQSMQDKIIPIQLVMDNNSTYWKYTEDKTNLVCSKCGGEILYKKNSDEPVISNYCPHCGEKIYETIN